MSALNNKRSTDGLTWTKLMAALAGVAITALLGLLNWNVNEVMSTIKDTKENVSEIKTQQAVAYNHQLNTDARLAQLGADYKDHVKDFGNFKITAYTYWQKDREKALRPNQ